MDIAALTDRVEVIDVLNRYATACDMRDWTLFDEVFTSDAETNFGNRFVFSSRSAGYGKNA
ncbi:MAG: nuclear transport factor 2 family protein [Chloroflexi bacterium]|nr:nuclear transport factor 2 family protein [Chloroflexota bacterium]